MNHQSITKSSPGLYIGIESYQSGCIQLGIVSEIVIKENYPTVETELSRIGVVAASKEYIKNLQ